LPQSRKDVLLDGKWGKTLDGQRFAIPTDPDQMLVFASDDHLRLLAQSKTVFMDGTFNVCPALYFQLFSIHGVVEDTVVPLAYSLLPSKTRTTYFDMLALIRKTMADMQLSFDPDTLVSDFESSSIAAVKQQFPRARHVGCFFHFCQAVWRRIQELGLARRYKFDPDFQLHVKSHMALAFLPPADIPEIAQELRQNYQRDDAVRAFHEYFAATWLDGVFQLSLWNQYDVPAFCRTNNTVESWHARFSRTVRVAHPNLYLFVAFLQREERHTTTVVHNARIGVRCRVKKSKYETVRTRIQSLYESHRSGDITTTQLLRHARHVIHTFT